MTFNPEPFNFGASFVTWLIVFGACLGIGVAIALLTGLIAGGVSGLVAAAKGMGQGVVDLVSLSPMRLGAIALLTFREAIRRKALLVFAIFILLFMFAGWFLGGNEDLPVLQVKVYVAFVLRVITWLLLPIALLLACWGIPEDIRRRSLHTVVTKPVRRSEVILGRMLGYIGINTLLLMPMAIVGYIWIDRQVPPSADSALVSRVPVYGDLTFRDPRGEPADAGVNVGDVWTFRSYVAGGTQARGVYLFEGVGPDDLTTVRIVNAETGEARTEEFLQLETNLEAFRTYKGNLDQGLMVQFTYVNPEDPEVRYVDPHTMEISEFGTNIHRIPPQLPVVDEDLGAAGATAEESTTTAAEAAAATMSPGTKTVNLFKTYAPQGRLQVEVACLDRGQYIGMSQSDLFIRTPDRPFLSGYSKAVFGIWLMTTLVTMLGVTASTFVKGPVATILTLVLVMVGVFFYAQIHEVSAALTTARPNGEVGPEGGGPVESIIRIVRHMNPTTELPKTTTTSVIKGIDKVFLGIVYVVHYIVPNFNLYNFSEYVANGFDVGWKAALLPAIGLTLAFLPPCVLLGYYSLRFRELEAK